MAPCVVQIGRAKTMITTALTRLFDLTHPIVLGPMGGVAGGALAAAVSNAGGLGLVGGGYEPLDLGRRQPNRAADAGVRVCRWACTDSGTARTPSSRSASISTRGSAPGAASVATGPT